jgi:hypothetical protein
MEYLRWMQDIAIEHSAAQAGLPNSWAGDCKPVVAASAAA